MEVFRDNYRWCHYPVSTVAMSGRSMSPEPGQVVWRPEGGAEASLAGTTPLEVKASDQLMLDPCLEEGKEVEEEEEK